MRWLLYVKSKFVMQRKEKLRPEREKSCNYEASGMKKEKTFIECTLCAKHVTVSDFHLNKPEFLLFNLEKEEKVINQSTQTSQHLSFQLIKAIKENHTFPFYLSSNDRQCLLGTLLLH